MSKKFYDEVCALMARLEVEDVDVVTTKVREIAQWFADQRFFVLYNVSSGTYTISVAC